ncbi:LacI family DNA-binding transcriptional regulator [Streptomyces lavendulae]|uniref:LacI family DNA-binding transcriptional regulator n=1 Tax=Streptomyces lavendulae TaxID=1914 RepID=UPI0024A51BBD|nr:LacI family DNA-binding transcriptional regulator [Streptomyces lavendulae]GLX21674.1 transcriptional regulator [Streptomyces lavendulae subsp. lavendulae]GLX29091.1 transcriptional regulator [Streptomyces lavendulae subsp. lavendulae]
MSSPGSGPGAAPADGTRRRPPTIADVARAASVSPTTVSHALNGLGKVDPRTRERIKRTAAELGYRPNLRAQRLRQGQAKAIALASSMPFSVAAGPSRLGFYMEIAAAAAERAMTHGYALVLVPPVRSGAALHSLDIDGAIVVEPGEDDPAVTQLRERGLPYVALGREVAPPGDAPYVDLRGGPVTELLLEHLREQGARRPALLIGAGGRHSSVDARAAYERAAAAAGRPPLVATAPEEGGEQAGYEACAALLAEHPETDAVCALVDVFAVGAVRAIRDSGRRVPEDVLVATRYDGPRARTCEPPLTAVDLQLDRAATDAVELLLARLRGAEAAVAVPPEPRLVARASSLRVTEPG